MAADGGVSALAILVINFNHARFLPGCLASLETQSFRDFEVTVYDNRSTDGSREWLGRSRWVGRVVGLGANLGYAAAANIGIRQSRAPLVLILNPDVTLGESFVERLVGAAEARPAAGSFTGKLLRFGEGRERIIDSTGHLLLRNRWALNRGEGEVDRGQYDEPAEVFGVCGAAALYRRAMLEDVKVGNEYFDETFFAYLDDVDLDWRARLRGWKAWYVPTAVAFHERGHKGRPWTRNPAVLRYTLRNRYLMLLRNDRARDVVRDLPAVLAMEVLRFADYLLTQPRALRGYTDLLRLIPHVLAERREIQGRRTAPPRELRRWLHAYPYGQKLREKFWARLRSPRGAAA